MNDHHDGRLARDLTLTLSRRRALGLFGAGSAGALLAACDLFGPPGHAEPNLTSTAADGSVCIKVPTETNGPFPSDGTNRLKGSVVNVLTDAGVVRSDIRSSFAGLKGTADGAQLDLTIRLVDVHRACAPLEGHLVYIWSCDARGRYSLYEIADCNYLRGAGVTDARGAVTLTTIFPGCYAGRWPHIHFEIFASPKAARSGTERASSRLSSHSRKKLAVRFTAAALTRAAERTLASSVSHPTASSAIARPSNSLLRH